MTKDPVSYYIAAILHAIEQLAPERQSNEPVAVRESDVKTYWHEKNYEKFDFAFLDDLYEDAIDVISQFSPLSIEHPPYGGRIYVMNNIQNVIDHFSEDRNYSFNRIYMLGANGERWLADCILEINSERESGVDERSELSRQTDEWEPTPLEVSEESAASAELAVERAIEEVRTNNGYASADPVERETVLATLETGQLALKSRKFTRATIKATLQRTLSYLTKKFTDSAIGVAAKKAFEAVLVLLS